MNSFKMPIKLAIVDDDKLSLTAQAGMLAGVEDIEILKFESAESALEHITEHKNIGILISDINLPGMPGELLVEKVMALNQGIDIIVVTGSQSLSKTIPCLMAGAREILSKPVEKQSLIDAVNLSVARFKKIIQFLQKPKV